MQYWLFKTEPDEFSIDDLKRKKEEIWDGIRNYQARNFLRDQVALGDLVFIYHSSCKEPGIVGIAKVIKTAFPDPSQFDSQSKYYDAKATTDNPRWTSVTLEFVDKLRIIALSKLKADKQLESMYLVQKGSRLSIQPVTDDEWEYILNTYS
ncbi:EVE domain-containing protein [Pseudoalteromonas sp. G4]|uniref:EVE domain-containing protein n=1 Tax=Pseudoalteromonas sp. G4 TaxID=2992761 RepID=UPI00237E8029|nr:EVE domain-containing protein [Pseudoalteromonas sp. G4]MDE3272604.1 EVE domain-containing protein [Pseudoalteromonas sp. G4]